MKQCAQPSQRNFPSGSDRELRPSLLRRVTSVPRIRQAVAADEPHGSKRLAAACARGECRATVAASSANTVMQHGTALDAQRLRTGTAPFLCAASSAPTIGPESRGLPLGGRLAGRSRGRVDECVRLPGEDEDAAEDRTQLRRKVQRRARRLVNPDRQRRKLVVERDLRVPMVPISMVTVRKGQG
jgi:hypothetical protein